MLVVTLEQRAVKEVHFTSVDRLIDRLAALYLFVPVEGGVECSSAALAILHDLPCGTAGACRAARCRHVQDLASLDLVGVFNLRVQA